MRILGVDYGRRRIGLAVSDELELAAVGLPTLEVAGKKEALAVVAAEASAQNASEIVVGLPLNMDGSKGSMAQAVEAFALELGQATGLPTRCWDERLTSAAAHRVLTDAGKQTRGRKPAVDRMAATVMLNTYLTYRKHTQGQST